MTKIKMLIKTNQSAQSKFDESRVKWRKSRPPLNTAFLGSPETPIRSPVLHSEAE